MAGVPPNTLRQNELPEYSFQGPFGGIQSEVPVDKIGRMGLAMAQNVLFRKAQMLSAPLFSPLPVAHGGDEIIQLVGNIEDLTGTIAELSLLKPSEPVMGIADFYNVNGSRRLVQWTPSRMFVWTGTGWQQVNGTLTGSHGQFFSWDVVGYKLYFSQQADKVQVWDGVTDGFDDADTNAVPAKYLFELGFHLLALGTVESGAIAANRVRWTGAADGTDWTSFNSGQIDLFNNLGPITGGCKLYQQGYIFQQWGITQVQLTGNGLAPFAFIPLGAKSKGNICPYSLATFGEDFACYVGKNNIYRFDGNYSIPIGDHPIDGGRNLGARRKIFADLAVAKLNDVFGCICTSANGVDYESYWLLIPSLNKAWVFHFDEMNWTQVFFEKGQLKGPIGIFSRGATPPRIMDLVGTIQDQSWSPATLTNVNPLDTIGISDANLNTVSLLNMEQPGNTESPNGLAAGDGWYVRSGALTYDDPRHSHNNKKVRLQLIDYAAVTIHFRLTNELGQTTGVVDLTYGNGSGMTITKVITANLPGKYLTWELSGPTGILWGLSEIALVYDVGGEIRGG